MVQPHDHLDITTHTQLKAFAHPLRHRIIGRLGQEPATVSILAEELGRPPGTVGHHTKVLEEAGLVEVVRTRQVNGITERWLGRSAATFAFPPQVGQQRKDAWLLGQFADARTDALADMDPEVLDETDLLTVRIARIDRERAAEWWRRLLALAEEFGAEPPGGERTHTLILGLTPGTALDGE